MKIVNKFKFLKENKIENNSFQDNALINLNNASL